MHVWNERQQNSNIGKSLIVIKIGRNTGTHQILVWYLLGERKGPVQGTNPILQYAQ